MDDPNPPVHPKPHVPWPWGSHRQIADREAAPLAADTTSLRKQIASAVNENVGAQLSGASALAASAVLAVVAPLQAERDALAAEVERLKRDGSPGVVHKVDAAFHRVVTRERDLARAAEDRLRAERDTAVDENERLRRDLEALTVAAEQHTEWGVRFESAGGESVRVCYTESAAREHLAAFKGKRQAVVVSRVVTHGPWTPHQPEATTPTAPEATS